MCVWCRLHRQTYCLVTVLITFLFSSTLALAQRELKDIPDPDPELERKSFIVADGFEVNLFAGDPKIAKPIQMNFDAQGRLWIASSEVYPHIKPGQKANDKILIIEDKDGDGKADETKVFADGLLIPTGVVPGDGGAYVANSTELIHLGDTNSDGKADRRSIVLSGFGTEDTHHLLHTLRWGHDGMLYMNQSIYIHSHIETPYGVRHLNGGGIWQFRPETMQLNVLCRGFVNPWGHHFDRWGQSFATDGAYGEGINYVFPGSVFVTAVGAKRRLTGLNPGSPKHCGLEILSGRHLPPEWSGNMITNDFRAHRVCRFIVTEDGSGYASRQEVEVIKTKHVAFRPIDVKMGPDGAIYIADWYNPIIQHGEVDFRDPRRDHVHGRIWRVTAKGRPTLKRPNLTKTKTPELLEQLKVPEEWTRLHAKLILKSRGAASVVRPLESWLSKLDPNEPEYEHHRLEGLWLYQCLDVVEPKLLEQLLKSKDHRVRAAAMRVVSAWSDRLDQPVQYMQAGVRDKHPRARLEAVRALSQIKSIEAARLSLLALDQPMDRFLDFALWQTMRDLEPYWLPAVRDGREDFDGNVEHLTFALKAVDSPAIVAPLLKLIQDNKFAGERTDSVLTLIATLGGPKELGQVFDAVIAGAPQSAPRSASLLNALVQACQLRKLKPAGDLNRIESLFKSENEQLLSAAALAAGTWKLEQSRVRLAAWATAEQPSSDSVRSASIDALALLGGVKSSAVLSQLAQSKYSLAIRTQAIGALTNLDTKAAALLTAKLLSDLPADGDPGDVLAPLLSRNEGPTALVDALGHRKLNADVAKLAIRAVQQSPRPSQPLLDRLRMAGDLATAGWKLTPEQIQKLVDEVKTKGEAHRGETIYRRKDMACMKCHAIAGAGGRVGPDLVSIGASAQIDYLIDSLIDPNKKIKENFHTTSIVTVNGKVITGVPVRRAGGVLVLRDADDKEVAIPIDNIDEQRDGRSLMPDGLVDVLTQGELIDLVRFLSELGKVGEFAVGKAQVVRRWQSLVWTKVGHRRLNRTSYDTAAIDDPALTWQPAYSRVHGDLPVEGLPRFVTHRGNDPTAFVRFQINVTTPGEVRLALNSIKGLRIWMDGKPAPIESELSFDLDNGTHTATLAINQAKREQGLRIELLESKNSPAQAQIVSGK